MTRTAARSQISSRVSRKIFRLSIARSAGWADAPMLPVQAATLRRRTSSTGSTVRSEEHTSELQSLMRNSYAVFCLEKKMKKKQHLGSVHENLAQANQKRQRKNTRPQY